MWPFKSKVRDIPDHKKNPVDEFSDLREMVKDLVRDGVIRLHHESVANALRGGLTDPMRLARLMSYLGPEYNGVPGRDWPIVERLRDLEGRVEVIESRLHL